MLCALMRCVPTAYTCEQERCPPDVFLILPGQFCRLQAYVKRSQRDLCQQLLHHPSSHQCFPPSIQSPSGTSSLEPLEPSASTPSPQPLLQSPLSQDPALDSPSVIMVLARGRPFPQIISATLPCMAEMAHHASQLKNGEKHQCPGLQVPLLFPSSCLHHFHKPKGMGEFSKKKMNDKIVAATQGQQAWMVSEAWK